MLNNLANKIKSFFVKIFATKRRSYVLSIIFVAALLIGYTVLTQPVRAADLDINILFRWIIEIMFWLSTIFMKFAIFFLELFINLAKYNNYVNAPTVIIGWLLVRDIANMFFVVVLLVIAIGTILGIEQYEWKKTLVKFVFAAIFINFSKLICGLIIDVAHVFTITFLNAIQALAGGNLISMFKMSEIQSMLESTDPIAQSGNFVYALFASAILALMMSGISMVAIGAYAIVMLARVVVLWVLIILSPLAFIMGVIPQAQSYSKQIWDKFGKQVMVAPVMVFFLWLSFATLGSGDAASQFGMDNASLAEAAGGLNTAGAVDVAKESDSLAVSISKAGTWENLASFMVAIAFMLVGINVVQGMGVVAGGLVQKAQDFGMSVAKIASGYTLGRKLAGTAWKGAKGLGKTVAWNFPGIGGERWALLGKTIGHNILASYRRAGTGLTKESIETGNKIAQVQAEKSQLENAGLLLANKEAQRQELIQKQEDGTITEKERKILNGGTDEETGEEIVPIAKQIEDLKAKKDMSQPEREALIKSKTQEIQGLQALQNSQTGGPIGAVFGWFARSQAAQRKHLRKSQGQAETLEKILSKRVGAEAGGWVFNRKSAQVEAQDRVERGILEAEDMRSKSKDDEFIKMGKAATLATTRQKWTGFGVGGRGIKGFFGGRETGASMVGEIVSRQRKAAGYESVIKALTAAQHISIDVGLRNKLNEAQKLAATGDMHKLNVLLGKEMPTEEEMEAARLRVIAKDDAEVAAGLPRKRRDEEGWEEAMRKEAGYDPQAVALVNEEMAKTTEAQQKEAHSNALKALAGTDVGKEIYTALAEAEIGAKMGEDFIKGIKNDKLRDKFKKAAEVYNSILDKAKAEGWDEKKMHHEIQNLANSTDPNNKFAAAIFYEENAHRAESQLKTAKSGVEQALDQAENKNWDEYLADKNGRKLIEDMLAQGKDREEIKAELEKMKKEGVAYSGDALGLMDDVLKGKAYEKVLGMYGEGKTDEEVEKALAESDFGYSLEDIKGFDKNKMLDLNDPKNRNLEGRQFIERLLREGKNREEIEATLKINGQSDKYLDEILKAKAKEKYDAMLATGKSTSEIDQEMQKYGFTNEQFFGLDYAALKQPIERPHHDSFRMQMAEAEVAQKGIERYFVITKRNSVRTAEAADKMEQFNEEEENAHTLERAVKNAKQEVGDAETDLGFIKSGETAEGLGKKLNGDGTTVGLIADRDTRKQALDNIGENLDVYGFAMQEANSHMAEVGALVGGKEGRDALATKLAELKERMAKTTETKKKEALQGEITAVQQSLDTVERQIADKVKAFREKISDNKTLQDELQKFADKKAAGQALSGEEQTQMDALSRRISARKMLGDAYKKEGYTGYLEFIGGEGATDLQGAGGRGGIRGDKGILTTFENFKAKYGEEDTEYKKLVAEVSSLEATRDRLEQFEKDSGGDRNVAVTNATAKLEAAKAKEVQAERDATDKTKQSDEAKRVQEVRDKRNKYLQSNAYAAEVYYDRGAQAIEQETKQARARLDQHFLGTEIGQAFMSRINMADLGEKAAQGFVEKIKQLNLAEILFRGANEMKTIYEKAAAKGIRMTEKEWMKELKNTSAAAKHGYSEELKKYYSSNAEISKEELTDWGSDAVTLDKKGVTEQRSATKKAVTKGMEKFNGMEREQAANLAAKSIKKLLSQQQSGQELDAQQRADLMASITFLTKQAWQDDGVGRIYSLMEEDAQKQNLGLLKGKALEEAKLFREIFVDNLKWAEKDVEAEKAGKVELKGINRSGGDRSNDISRLFTYAGELTTMQAEGAVLQYQRAMKKQGRSIGYADAVEELAKNLEKEQGKIKGLFDEQGKLKTGGEAEFKEIAERMGMVGAKVGRELSHFFSGFMRDAKTGMVSTAGEAKKKFIDKLKTHTGAAEYMTGIKDLGMATTHIDDVGHLIYDMTDGIVHGQLHDDAERFLLGDWRKKSPGERMRNLKVHNFGRLNEETNTASQFSAAALEDTYNGVATELDLKGQDTRNLRNIVKMSADEEAVTHSIKGNDGKFHTALSLGSSNSSLLNRTYKHVKKPEMRRKMAMREMAQDWATMLNHSPQALLYALGKNAGVKYEDSMQGITNIAVPNFDGSMRHVGNVHELIDWISEVRGETVKDPEIQDEFRRQGWGDFESVEGKNGVVMDRLKACSKSKSSEEDEYQQ